MTAEQKVLTEEYRKALMGFGSPIEPDLEPVSDFTCRDERIPRRWREGDCHILSLALYAATGWEPLGLYDTRIGGGPEDDGSGGYMVHSVVMSPDGLWAADGHGWTPNQNKDMSRLAQSYGVQPWSEAWCTCLPTVLEEGVAPIYREDEYRAICLAAVSVTAHLLRNAPAQVIPWLTEPGHWDREREKRKREWEEEARSAKWGFGEETFGEEPRPKKEDQTLLHFGKAVVRALREETAAWARSRTEAHRGKRMM